jgi:hypothetical protein
MKLEYDKILEIFDYDTEQLYISAFKHIQPHIDIISYVLTDEKQLEKLITDIDRDFKKLKDKLITFVAKESKSNYEALFEQSARDAVKSKIQSFSQDNTP